jgi:indole-3-acetate monooxygenase
VGDRNGAGREAPPGTAARTAAPAAVLAVVAAHRAWAEANAKMAPEVVAAVGGAGLFRMVAPARYGGLELAVPDQVRALEALAHADPTVAWCASNAAVAGRAAAHLAPEAAARLFERPDAYHGFGNSVGGTARRVGGGYLVSGRWPVVSGAHHARWLVAGATVEGAEPPEPGGRPSVVWPIIAGADLRVEDTWDAAGAMRGTGSHAVSVVGAFVPDDLLHRWEAPRREDGPLYRSGRSSVTSLGTAAMALGALRSARDALVEAVEGRVSTIDGSRPRDWADTQRAAADLAASWRTAWAGVTAVAEEVWAAALVEAEPPLRLRAEAVAVANHAVDAALAGVSRAYTAGTADALRRGHALDLALRDVHGMAVNWERLRRLHLDAGGVLLGAAPRFRAL